MKTAGFNFRTVLPVVALLACPALASWNLGADADLRYGLAQWRESRVEVHALGLSLRKTIADQNGDRLILFGLYETEDNLAEHMLHEAYLRLKGPMGKWNLTVGRFGLPFGLLPVFSTSRLPYTSVSGRSLGMDSDNGAMLSGTIDWLDYAVSLSQGYGPHRIPGFPGHVILTGRAGITLGESEELAIGVSAAAGQTETGHMPGHAESKYLAALDAGFFPGRMSLRCEVNAGTTGGHPLVAGFAAIDFAVLPRWDLTAAGSAGRHGSENFDSWYAGIVYKHPWMIIRGGYRYGYFSSPHHEIMLQAYRLLSVNF